MRKTSWRTLVAAMAAVLTPALAARGAEPSYFKITVSELKLTAGKIPAGDNGFGAHELSVAPWAHLDDGGEAYLCQSNGYLPPQWSTDPAQFTLVARTTPGHDVTGEMFLPSADRKRMECVKFVLPAKLARPDAKSAYFEGKLGYEEWLLSQHAPGAAWFRHEARSMRHKLGEKEASRLMAAIPWTGEASTLDDTYDLFTGGRALSENLQLDRALPTQANVGKPTVILSTIKGITVKAMDWTALIKDKKPALDPLASIIPIDQHAVFFPSFDAMMSILVEADRDGAAALEFSSSLGQDAMTKQRYQKQLCLPATQLSRLLGPKLIDGIAITGSDLYLRTGSDVAILFSPRNADALRAALMAQVTAARQRDKTSLLVEGKVEGVDYNGIRNPNRSICSYQVTIGNAIVVSNSLAQIKRLIHVQAGKTKALASAPEYIFFRDRYKRTDDTEAAFAVISDATIRRWCSPRWRIADSRRTQAGAILGELEADHLNALVSGQVPRQTLRTDRGVIGLGQLSLSPAGVRSSGYNTAQFLTPIIELPMDAVTPAEEHLYERWRDTYQGNWSMYFDPIAVRMSIKGSKVAMDLTVMPLIDSSQYAYWVDRSKGAKLQPGNGDAHDTLLQMFIAVNSDSPEMLADGNNFNLLRLNFNPLSWVGPDVSVYVDDDPYWARANKSGGIDAYVQENLNDLPLGLFVQSKSSAKLAMFMTSVHAFIDRSVPNITTWTTLKYKDRGYVKVTALNSGITEIDKTALYYVTAPDGLTVSLNENLIKRAIDRQIERENAKAAKKPAPAGPALLGDSMAISITSDGWKTASEVFSSDYARREQRTAWNNIWILNQWKRLYPNEDPVALHERLWGVKLTDPAGGTYVWNKDLYTMESVNYGSPADPKAGPILPPELQNVTRAAAGLTFENNGLRARAMIQRK